MTRSRSILVVTRANDNASVDAVSRRLLDRGVFVVRLDTDRFPLVTRGSTRIDRDGVAHRFVVDGVVVDGNDIGAVWYRRFAAGASLPDDLADLRRVCVDESRRSLYGTIAGLAGPQLDRLEDVRRCDHKELQLLRARELGIAIPTSLFTNDVDDANAFIDDARARNIVVVTKMQSSFAVIRGGKEQVVYTSVVDDDARADLAGLRYCPMQFQHRVDKRLELRATVVGDRVFCAAIDSQQSAKSQVDWRKDGVGLLHRWTRYSLPDDVEKRLLRLVRSFGLGYAAADFIVTPAGELVFLEINAGGEWFWLDEHFAPEPGWPIATAIADWLHDAARDGRAPHDADDSVKADDAIDGP